jgi:uncharacterized protein (DUF697 family)
MAYSASYPIPRNMLNTIEGCAGGLGGVGIFGGLAGPGADLVVIAPVWAGMVVTLAVQAGKNMDKETAKKLTIAVATGVGSFALGTKVGATVLGWLLAIPSAGLSLAASAAANAALNAKFTHAYGKAVALYFLQTDSIDSIDVMTQVLISLVAIQFGFSPDGTNVTA